MFSAGFLCRPSKCEGEEKLEISLEQDSERYSELLMQEIFLEPKLDYSHGFDLQDAPSTLASSNHNERKDEHHFSRAVGTTVCMDAWQSDSNLVQQRVSDQVQVISSEAVGNKVEEKLSETLEKKIDSVVQHVVMEKKFDYVMEKKFDMVHMNCNDDVSEKSATSTARCDVKSKDASLKKSENLGNVIQHVVMEKKFDCVTEKKLDLVNLNYNDDVFEKSAPSTAPCDVKSKKASRKKLEKIDSVIQHVVMEKKFDCVAEKKFDLVNVNCNDDVFEKSAPTTQCDVKSKNASRKKLEEIDSVMQHVVMEKKFEYATEKKFDLVNVNYHDDVSENSAPSAARCDVKSNDTGHKDESKKDHGRRSVRPGDIFVPKETRQEHQDHGIHLGSPLCGDAFTLDASELSQEVSQHKGNGRQDAARGNTSCPRDVMHRVSGSAHGRDNVTHSSPKGPIHKKTTPQDSCCDHGRDTAPHASPRDPNSKVGKGNSSSIRDQIHEKHVQGQGKDNSRHCSPRDASRTGHHIHRDRDGGHGKRNVPHNSPKDLSHKRQEPQDSCCDHGKDNALHASPGDSNTSGGNVGGNTSITGDRIHENHVQGHGKDNAWYSNPRGASRTGRQRGSSKSGTQRGDTVSPRFHKPEEHRHGQCEGEAQRRDLTSVPKGLVKSRVSEIEKAESEGGNPKYPNLLTSLGGQRNDGEQEQYLQNTYLDRMIAVGDVLAVTVTSHITQIGATGGMFGHVLLVAAVPRCIRKHTPEYEEFLGSWPAGKVREIYQVPVIESTRSAEGINETDLLLYINPKSGKITLHGEVDRDGEITAFENDEPEEVALWQSPSVLRDSSCSDLKKQVIEEMKENQANWSWYTAVRAFVLPAAMEAQSLTLFQLSANKQQLFKEIQDCWNGAPICSSLPVIFWQRYLCKLSESGRASEKFANKSGPLDMIMGYMPLRADRSLPGDLLKVLQTSGWTNIQQLPTQKHSMNFGVQRRHSRA